MVKNSGRRLTGDLCLIEMTDPGMDLFHQYAIRHIQPTDNDWRSLNGDPHPSCRRIFRPNQHISTETSLWPQKLGRESRYSLNLLQRKCEAVSL